MKQNNPRGTSASCEHDLHTSNISEYRIGHTTYIVESYFSLDCTDTLEDIIKRLIARKVGELNMTA